MNHFEFKAKKSTGEIYKGQRDAEDRFDLYRMLREDGSEIISVKEGSASNSILKSNITLGGLLGRVKVIDKINFAQNLGLMLEAGLSLTRALNVIERQSKSVGLKKVLVDLNQNISKGMTFAESLEKHPKVFPQLFVSMVHAGEQSGTLAQSLKAVSSQMNASFALSKRIRGAMIYPAVIMSVMVLIGIIMMIYVVPTLLKTFTDLNVELPASTQLVLTISNLFQHQGPLVLIVIIAATVFMLWWSKKESGKRAIHMFMLKAPIFGPLTQEVNAARTARTLSSLLTSGVDVVESVSITSAVVQNVYFRDVLHKAEEAIKKGELMSKVFTSSGKLYPAFFAEMLSVGEETGQIGHMLMNVAQYYETDVEQKTKDMSTVIEPILIVMIGAAVGFFAIAMISPMYSLVNVI